MMGMHDGCALAPRRTQAGVGDTPCPCPCQVAQGVWADVLGAPFPGRVVGFELVCPAAYAAAPTCVLPRLCRPQLQARKRGGLADYQAAGYLHRHTHARVHACLQLEQYGRRLLMPVHPPCEVQPQRAFAREVHAQACTLLKACRLLGRESIFVWSVHK